MDSRDLSCLRHRIVGDNDPADDFEAFLCSLDGCAVADRLVGINLPAGTFVLWRRHADRMADATAARPAGLQDRHYDEQLLGSKRFKRFKRPVFSSVLNDHQF